MKQILNIFPYCKGKVNYLNYKHHLYLYCKKQIIMETQEQCRMTKDVVKTTYIPHTHDKLGINIHIPENATVEINNAGAKKEYLIDSVEIVFGIGKDYVGYITMDMESYKALKNGEPITIMPFTED